MRWRRSGRWTAASGITLPLWRSRSATSLPGGRRTDGSKYHGQSARRQAASKNVHAVDFLHAGAGAVWAGGQLVCCPARGQRPDGELSVDAGAISGIGRGNGHRRRR